MFVSFRRRSRTRWLRNLSILACAVLLLDLWIALHNFKVFEHNLVANTVSHVQDLPPQARDQKIYIAAQFWTGAESIIEFWQRDFLKLIDALGPQNVYVSIIASHGLDNTHELIHNLDVLHLGPRNIARTIIIDSTTHQDAIDVGPVDKNGNDRSGWIHTGDSKPPGQKELRRIPYLSDIRNRGLEPLLRIYRDEGIKFDKILFINDVMFEPSDILTLLATNNGVFDAACSFDFKKTPAFYDTFALRDHQGYAAVTSFFPFYRSSTSRHQVLQGQPVSVKSCWNGIVAADAAPYYDRESRFQLGQEDTSITNDGLRYRGIPDSLASKHLEASECCLIHADLIASGQAKKGIFMNPAVRVAYFRDRVRFRTTAYEDTHTGPKGLGWVTLNEYIRGIWSNRVYRTLTFPYFEKREISRRLQAWKKEGKKLGEVRDEPGDYCMINEMHILIWNGWKHV